MLLPYDQIIIPFRQLFVTVSGAVHTPGRYPYIPDRGWRYYVGLAGGIDREKNVNDKLRITDVLDRERPKDGPIMPEDTINAEYNGLLYQFNRAAPIITTLASITSLVLGILSLVAR
jgi:protein involved in polysaccharide export with SLBB domain